MKLSEMGSRLIDWRRLEGLANGDSEILSDLIRTYLDQMSQRLKELDVSIRDSSADEIHRLAHSCAGSSAQFGAQTLVSLFRELENMESQGKLTGGRQLLDKATHEFQKIRNCLEAGPPEIKPGSQERIKHG